MRYTLLKCLLLPIGVMPRCVLVVLSNFMAFFIYKICGYRKQTAMLNLQKCFPQKTAAELDSIAVGVYRSLCDTMLNLLRIRFASRRRVMKTVHYKNPQVLTTTENQDGIVFAGHYSCWEYMGISQQFLPKHQTIAAYQPSHGAIDKIVTQARMRFGAEMTALAATFRTIFQYRNQGKHTYTLMVTDQSPSVGENQYYLQFLGQNTHVFITPERIAKKIGSKVLYLRVVEKRRFQYEYEFVVLSENAAAEADYVVTQRFYHELEKDITSQPQLWIWTHRRWK